MPGLGHLMRWCYLLSNAIRMVSLSICVTFTAFSAPLPADAQTKEVWLEIWAERSGPSSGKHEPGGVPGGDHSMLFSSTISNCRLFAGFPFMDSLTPIHNWGTSSVVDTRSSNIGRECGRLMGMNCKSNQIQGILASGFIIKYHIIILNFINTFRWRNLKPWLVMNHDNSNHTHLSRLICWCIDAPVCYLGPFLLHNHDVCEDIRIWWCNIWEIKLPSNPIIMIPVCLAIHFTLKWLSRCC